MLPGASGSDEPVSYTHLIDKNHNKVKLSSIMRDAYVNIPGRGMDKITHAYAFGGAELAVRTLNENFDLDITDFATVDSVSYTHLCSRNFDPRPRVGDDPPSRE